MSTKNLDLILVDEICCCPYLGYLSVKKRLPLKIIVFDGNPIYPAKFSPLTKTNDISVVDVTSVGSGN